MTSCPPAVSLVPLSPFFPLKAISKANALFILLKSANFIGISVIYSGLKEVGKKLEVKKYSSPHPKISVENLYWDDLHLPWVSTLAQNEEEKEKNISIHKNTTSPIW